MHHRVFEDGSFLFQDVFGITRVDPGGRAKTLATAVWTTWHRLAPLGAPPSVLARVGAKRALRRVELAGLTHAPQREDIFAVAASDDVVARWGGRVASNTGELLRPREVVNAGIFHPATAWLGPALGDDGTLAGITPGVDDPELTLLDPSEGGFVPRWRVPLRAGSDTVLAAHRTRRGVALVGWRPLAADATIVAFDDAGAPVARRTVPCLALPAVDEGRALYQPDASRLASMDLDTGEVRAIALPDAAHHGPGLPLAGRGRSLFVPPDAESVLDLDRGVDVPRRLSPSQRARRAALTRWLADHAARRLRAGMLFPMQARLGARPFVAFWEPLPSSVALAAGAHRELLAALAAAGEA